MEGVTDSHCMEQAMQFKGQDESKFAKSDLECFILDEYFIPNSKKENLKEAQDAPKETEENVIRPPPEEVQRKREERKIERKNKKGKQKEKRPIMKIDFSERLCNSVVDARPGEEPRCSWANCKMQHDVAAYMASKPPDIAACCYVFSQHGFCPRGVTCRFAGAHLDTEGRNVRREGWKEVEDVNRLDKQLQAKLRKNQYDFQRADEVCKKIWDRINGPVQGPLQQTEAEAGSPGEPPDKKARLEVAVGPVVTTEGEAVVTRKVDWKGKTYLAPLTTVGNLPFRRVCKDLGVDITCGEMALALPLLQGHGPEWALLKKHKSEDVFGVQVCGCSPGQMARLAQLLEEQVDCDFVDINMGCPIDLIYKKGMGSGLMSRRRPMENIVRSMSSILTRPLTVKMRTGVYSDRSIAHELFPLVEDWGAGALTLHGRSREQRYTRLADWDYINTCAKSVNIPVFGNGDVMNYEQYNQAVGSGAGVAGVMVARGALIKPWIFTEIKEQRHWDISAGERLDLVRDFCNYGLEHWGSDDKGVETTRRFLLEWLSFAHRYVPHGLLMFPPQRINQRVPLFRGRTETETLLASPDSRDWVRISEMFLGRVRPDFQFVAKHKANSYS